MQISLLLCEINPYYKLVKYLSKNQIEKEIVIDKYLIDYHFMNDSRVKYNLKCNYNYINIEFIEKNIDLNIKDYIMTDEKLQNVNKYIKEYYNESTRINNIFKKFIDQFLDPTKLKNVHLSNLCKNREKTTSYCNIKESINEKFKEPIINKMKNLYFKYKGNEIKIEKQYVSTSFIIILTVDLFTKYIDFLNYLIRLLKEEPVCIFDPNLIYKIDKTIFYCDKNLNEIKIKHFNCIHNTEIIKYNISKPTNFITFKKYNKSNRNDIMFDLY